MFEKKIIISFLFMVMMKVGSVYGLEECDGAENYDVLLKGINTFDEKSFESFVKNRYCYDGGDLEDLHRSSGLFFEKKPEVFLSILTKHNVSYAEAENFLVMLPLETVDDAGKKISFYKKRIFIVDKMPASGYKNLFLKRLSEGLKSWE